MLNSVNICWEFSWSLVFPGEPFIAMLIKRDQRIRDLHYFAAVFYAVLGVIEIERNWPARYVLYICDISSRLRFEDWFSENTNSLCLFVDWQNFRMIIDYSVRISLLIYSLPELLIISVWPSLVSLQSSILKS